MPKKAKSKVPQITFKYFKKDCGEVDLSLPGFEDKPTPPELDQVLEDYGFVNETSDSEGAIYVDGLEPQGDLFEEEFARVVYRVPVRLMTQIIKGKTKRKTVFEMQMPGANIGKGDSLYDAFCKAYGHWHKAGRPIGGVPFITAFQGAVDRANKELSKKAGLRK